RQPIKLPLADLRSDEGAGLVVLRSQPPRLRRLHEIAEVDEMRTVLQPLPAPSWFPRDDYKRKHPEKGKWSGDARGVRARGRTFFPDVFLPAQAGGGPSGAGRGRTGRRSCGRLPSGRRRG